MKEELKNRLFEGNRRYVEGKLKEREWKTIRNGLLEGQKPFATVITCSDSRVVPEYIFDKAPGELFIIRVAGNILDRAVIGSIEYGVGHLHTPLLIILGHSRCGAVTATCTCGGKKEGNYIDYIMEKIKPAVKEGNIEESVLENMRCVAEEIKKESSTVKNALEKGELRILGMKYYLEDGRVETVFENGQ
ncbi:carbonic anhydrase [Candidatus Micrarchaeota archaeon]|nr:carbonic anhydrase [Candidatus Micrarchaeota archaeon]